MILYVYHYYYNRKPVHCQEEVPIFLQNATVKTEKSLPQTVLYGKSVPVCGVPVFAGGRRAGEKALAKLLETRKGNAALVFTPNFEFLTAAKSSPATRSLLSRADLSLPDGVGALLLSGLRVKERFAGIEAGEFLLSLAARRGYRVYLLGGKAGVSEAAASALTDRFPALRIVGTHHGYFPAGGREEADVTREIAQSGAEVLVVCTGFPRQECYLARVRDRLPALRIGIALGGALDVWSGKTKRAPAWMQRFGLEWAWRCAREPERVQRMLKSAGRGLF